jgi:hypothetical protein
MTFKERQPASKNNQQINALGFDDAAISSIGELTGGKHTDENPTHFS